VTCPRCGASRPEQEDRAIEHHVLWHCAPLASSEYATLRESAAGYQFRGLTVLPREGVPCHVSYEVSVDREWYPVAATAAVEIPSGTLRIALSLAADGRWALDGSPAPQLLGCQDLDLGWTPATNTIPIRRLGLAAGETAQIKAAWIRFPELDVVANEQRYTRLADDRWRYQSGDYDFELRTDERTGLVLRYGDDLWYAAAAGRGGAALPPAARFPAPGMGELPGSRWRATRRRRGQSHRATVPRDTALRNAGSARLPMETRSVRRGGRMY
jgi:uncharacterized protein